MFYFIRHHDWPLNVAIAFLALASLLILYSIEPVLFWRQFFWWLIAAAAIFLLAAIDWRPLINYRWVIFSIYGIALLILSITLVIAPVIRQVKSWIVIGPFQLQTSELAKAALIVLLAYFLAKHHIKIAHWRTLLQTLVYAVLPVGLILLQPDLGTAIIILGIWFGFLLVSGIQWRHLATGFLLFAVIFILGWQYFLKDYQKERVVSLFRPEVDPLGINYSVAQSKIAVGSAGFFGKGFGQGTQVQLGFLPEARSDFVLAAFIEEWGLFGGLMVIVTFAFLCFRIIKIGLESSNNFSKLLCLGTVFMFLMQFAINVGSTLGLLPVIGVSFPFLSYGGSNLLTSALLIGIIQSVVVRSR